MLVLGLHFGHDSSVTVVRDGVVLGCLEVERLTRKKHCIGLTVREVLQLLDDVGVSSDDIDACSVTSTQGIEYLFPDPARLSFRLDDSDHEAVRDVEQTIVSTGKRYLDHLRTSNPGHAYMGRLYPGFQAALDSMPSFPSVECFVGFESWADPGLWDEPRRPDEPSGREAAALPCFPIVLTLDGREIPGRLFSHHYAHAAYTYYTSGHESAAIVTHDGSLPGASGFDSGLVCWGEGPYVYPVAPHYLSIANLYERVAFMLQLGFDTGAGKLMGLAPYGSPVFFTPAFVAGHFEGAGTPSTPRHRLTPDWMSDEANPLLYRWVNHCLNEADARGYDLEPFADPQRVLSPINADIAASTQKLFEETTLHTVDRSVEMLSRMGLQVDHLCISGGAALNCPANSRMALHGWGDLHVPPAVHDGGLSIGSALALSHHILGVARPSVRQDAVTLAFLGLHSSAAGDAVVPSNVSAREVDDAPLAAAEMLAENRVIAWFSGRSEVGPRALGGRSILASPDAAENWPRVNRLKGRESWRPFAPVVLESHAAEYFSGVPIPSPFMLFTATVNGGGLPAVTHVDGSSRIQTVDPSIGEYFTLLEHFYRLTGTPVLMNTSFNGPGEPVVETLDDALAFLSSSSLDAVVTPTRIYTRTDGIQG